MTDFDFWSDANLHGGKLKDAIIGSKTEASSADAGALAYDGGSLWVHNGSDWVALGSSGDLATLSGKVTTLENKVGDNTSGSETGIYALIAALDSGKVNANNAITASTTGRYFVVQYDAKGLVTGGREATADDIPALPQSKITDLETDLAGKVPTTRAVNGKALSENITLTKSDLNLNYADGAQVNVIEGISFKASGATEFSDLSITSKKAQLDLSQYALKSDMTSAFKYMGTKANYTELEAVTGQTKGDVWNVTAAVTISSGEYAGTYPPGTNFAWDGARWDPLGGTTAGYVPNTTTINTHALSSNVTLDATDVLTSAQQDAVNSGITSTKVGTYDGYADTIAEKMSKLASATGGRLLVTTAGDLGDISESSLTASDVSTKIGYVDTGKAVTAYLSEHYVGQVSGKGLSTEDYTTAEQTKLAGIAEGAQANVIESVKRNGTALTITGKAVDITVPTKTSDLTNDSTFQTASDVTTTLGGYYTKTAIQGYFVSDSVSTVMNNELGYAVAEKNLSAAPFMAQLLDGSGNVVMADIQLDTENNKVIVRTNTAKTGILKVLCLPA